MFSILKIKSISLHALIYETLNHETKKKPVKFLKQLCMHRKAVMLTC